MTRCAHRFLRYLIHQVEGAQVPADKAFMPGETQDGTLPVALTIYLYPHYKDVILQELKVLDEFVEEALKLSRLGDRY